MVICFSHTSHYAILLKGKVSHQPQTCPTCRKLDRLFVEIICMWLVLFAGVEIRYEIYSPQIQKIDVLRLEKRLDDQLFYLRDAPVEYSTVPFDFEPVPHPPGVAVPINTMKVCVTIFLTRQSDHLLLKIMCPSYPRSISLRRRGHLEQFSSLWVWTLMMNNVMLLCVPSDLHHICKFVCIS